MEWLNLMPLPVDVFEFIVLPVGGVLCYGSRNRKAVINELHN